MLSGHHDIISIRAEAKLSCIRYYDQGIKASLVALLLPSQIERLFAFVEQSAFSRDEFELIQRDSQLGPGLQAHELRHKSTRFFFAFDYIRLKRPRGAIAQCATCSPWWDSLQPVSVAIGGVDSGFLNLLEWLSVLKREIAVLKKENIVLPDVVTPTTKTTTVAEELPTAKEDVHPRVFISYSHDSSYHENAVHQLAEDLRQRGIDVNIDRYEPHPKQGWPQWMLQQVRQSSFVLCVCTEKYKERLENQVPSDEGKGARFEGSVITQALFENVGQNDKFIPVTLNGTGRDHVPELLRPFTCYALPTDFGMLYLPANGSTVLSEVPTG